MAHSDAQLWNQRYTHDSAWSDDRSPRQLLTAHLDLLPQDGLAIDMACGTSATGRFLVTRGWRVIALDVSIAGLRLAQTRARKAALPVWMAVMDLTDPWLPCETFDVVMNFYYLSRPLWKTYRETLKPGGLLFFETFLGAAGKDPNHYLDPLELKEAFGDWEIISYAELQRPSRSPDDLAESRQVAQLVARKPI